MYRSILTILIKGCLKAVLPVRAVDFISAASECNVALNKQDIAKYFYRFRIPAASKVVIREQLNTRGVNRESVYVTENPAHQAVIDDINKRIYI